MGKENSREKTQKAHKSNLFCASGAFSWLFHCLPASGLLSNPGAGQNEQGATGSDVLPVLLGGENQPLKNITKLLVFA